MTLYRSMLGLETEGLEPPRPWVTGLQPAVIAN